MVMPLLVNEAFSTIPVAESNVASRSGPSGIGIDVFVDAGVVVPVTGNGGSEQAMGSSIPKVTT